MSDHPSTIRAGRVSDARRTSFLCVEHGDLPQSSNEQKSPLPSGRIEDVTAAIEAAYDEFVQGEAWLPPGFNVLPILQGLRDAILSKVLELSPQ